MLMNLKSETISLTAILCAIASLGQAAVVVSASDTAPTQDASDQYYLPGTGINDANLVGGGGDAFTYVAHNRTSKGQTFTTGANVGGYSLAAISVQQVQFATGNTFWSVANGAQFEFAFGSISGTTKTQLFHTTSATTNFALTGPVNGSGKYISFDLSGESLPALAANTSYYFEITTTSNPLYFELNGTSANGYAGGQSFSGSVSATITAGEAVTYSTGDFAFHADLAAVPEPSSYAALAGGLILVSTVCRRKRRS